MKLHLLVKILSPYLTFSKDGQTELEHFLARVFESKLVSEILISPRRILEMILHLSPLMLSNLVAVKNNGFRRSLSFPLAVAIIKMKLSIVEK